MLPDPSVPAAVDVVVVGAGPAGAAAAFHLASAGRDVLLLDGRQFPRDKACGDLLTAPAVASLDRMGVLARLDGGRPAPGLRVAAGGRSRIVHGGPGLVVRRAELDLQLRFRAVEAGSRSMQGKVVEVAGGNGSPAGVTAWIDGRPLEIRAHVVVLAAGARSPLVGAAEGACLGIGARCYFAGVAGLGDLPALHLDAAGRSAEWLGHGWVVPVAGGLANVGVATFETLSPASAVAALRGFVAQLAERDTRFATARPCGAVSWGFLRYDFGPDRVAAGGVVRVGDAAGLISPLTGEGIGAALDSGRIAAETIDAFLAGRVPDLAGYGPRLAETYAAHLEAGRYLRRHVRLGYRVVQGSFASETPVARLARRAALAPAGAPPISLGEVLDDAGPCLTDVRDLLMPDALAVADLLASATRRQWPFVARMATMAVDGATLPLRPALLLLVSAYLGAPRPDIVEAAAALELASMAALCHLSVEDAGASVAGRREWGTIVSVTAGDYLLAEAVRMVAKMDQHVADAIAGVVADVCLATLTALAQTPGATPATTQLDLAAATSARIFAAACRTGARLAGLEPAVTGVVSEYGRYLGTAWHLAEVAASPHSRRASLATAGLIAAGMVPPGAPDRVLWHQALVAARSARDSLATVPPGPPRRALVRLAGFATRRVVPVS